MCMPAYRVLGWGSAGSLDGLGNACRTACKIADRGLYRQIRDNLVDFWVFCRLTAFVLPHCRMF
jgi:hypothetical protein